MPSANKLNQSRSSRTPLQTLDNFVTAYAYGILHKPTSSSTESVQSAYEVLEDLESAVTKTDDSEYNSAYSSTPPKTSVLSSTSRRTFDSLSSSSDDDSNRLPDILRGVKSTIDSLSVSLNKKHKNFVPKSVNTKYKENIFSKPLTKTHLRNLVPLTSAQSTPIKADQKKRGVNEVDISYPKLLTDQELVSANRDKQTARVVHDLVFEKYEESYRQLLEKLKKLKLSLEENKFRKVIVELESMFHKGCTTSDEENYESEGSKILRNVVASKKNKNFAFFEPELVKTSAGLPTKYTSRYTSKSYYARVGEVAVEKWNISHITPVKVQVFPCTSGVENIKTTQPTPMKKNHVNTAENKFKHGPYCNSWSDQQSGAQCEDLNESTNSEFDEQKFIENAIGVDLLQEASSENYILAPTTSIGTDDVSALLSSKSTLVPIRRRRRKTRKSLSSVFNTSSNHETSSVCDSTEVYESGYLSNTQDLVNEPFRYSYASYEDVSNLGMDIYRDAGKKELKKHISINEEIIKQSEKMLRHGLKKMPDFIGSYAHLEGERILLLAKMRKDTLASYMCRVPESPREAVATVTIENLRCFPNMPENHHSSGQRHYVCILQHKTTIYSTRIAAPNRLGWVDFGGYFIFNNVSNTFNINIQLYYVNIREQLRTCSHFFTSVPKIPLMELAGEARIGILNIKNKKFTLKKKNTDKTKEYKMTASIDATMCWPDTLKTFMTVGTGKIDHQPLWNRQWCVLEGDKLKCYNYPSDENYCPPVRTIDLQQCKSCHDVDIKYLSQKTLCLFSDDGMMVKRILFTPDHSNEYEVWSNHFEIILALIREWKMSKEQQK